MKSFSTLRKQLMNETYHDLKNVYVDDFLSIFNEISDLINFYNSDEYKDIYDFRGVYPFLIKVRDILVNDKPEDEFENYYESLKENITSGSLKLEDGSMVKISKQDADSINDLIGNDKQFKHKIMKSKKDFSEILNLAKALQ